ncbi:MAG: molybdopterin-guanine dinucleotide biosynthesis protein B [Rhodospirillaceae bacterium]|nr:molybdopterin-guanine dinucleotide biosynthesis protein B [Rhodospirillaceae bacterium]|tara:strand:- start:1749 stop:2258 length:510 start_codon:yes stop_codon:yes gene_type:complete
MKLFGITGWSGSGKTTLITKLIPALKKHKLTVATIKHAHHNFDIDQKGKDSFRFRKSGAREILISSSHRWVLIHENTKDCEPTLAQLIEKLSPVDILLIEGFKHEPYPKLEVYRPSLKKPQMWPADRNIIAVATDVSLLNPTRPHYSLEDVPAITKLIMSRACPLGHIL